MRIMYNTNKTTECVEVTNVEYDIQNRELTLFTSDIMYEPDTDGEIQGISIQNISQHEANEIMEALLRSGYKDLRSHTVTYAYITESD